MNLIKANKDPEILIKETDQDSYHVEQTRIMVDRTGKHPERMSMIQIYDQGDYNRTFGKNGFIAKNGSGAMNFDEFRVVHDPVLNDEAEQKRNDAEAKRVAKEAKAAKAAEKQKLEDEKVTAEKEAEDKKAAEEQDIKDQAKEDAEILQGIKDAKVKKAAERRAKKKAEDEAEKEAERLEEEAKRLESEKEAEGGGDK